MNVPHRARWLALGIAAAVLVVGLSIALAAALTRPAPSAATPGATPSPTPSSTAQPAPGTAGTSAEDVRQHQQYRAYVSALVRGGTGVMAGIGGLAGCRISHAECVARLGQASDQVAALRSDLAANPAPACLASSDERLQDALSFQEDGLDMAQAAVRSQDRVRLVQGLLLTGVGLWRSGQAIAAGRASNC